MASHLPVVCLSVTLHVQIVIAACAQTVRTACPVLFYVMCQHVDCVCKQTTRAVPAMKPEATAIGDPQDGRWKITLMFYGCKFCILKFLGLLRYSRRPRRLYILRIYNLLADDTSMTSLVSSDLVLLRRNQSQRSCFAVIGYAGSGYY